MPCPLVLQGHIAIDSAVFPEGTPGFVLDAYARRALWAEGLDYAHGTGNLLFFNPMSIIVAHVCVYIALSPSPPPPLLTLHTLFHVCQATVWVRR